MSLSLEARKQLFSGLDEAAEYLHEKVKAKGQWDGVDKKDLRHKASRLMWISSEVSEAFEALRRGDEANFREEVADVLILTLDLAAAYGLSPAAIVAEKDEKNDARPEKNGTLF